MATFGVPPYEIFLRREVEVIAKRIVDKLRVSVCAILRMAQRHEDWRAGMAPDTTTVPRPKCEVVATGFLVRENLVLTNRHVVEMIASDHQKTGHHERWYLEFTYPDQNSGLSQTYVRINNMFGLVDPSGAGGLDVGLLEFKRADSNGLECGPAVEFGDLTAIAVGVDIAVCGFPLGNALLVGSPGLWRFGPVFHHGIVSGIAPFEVANPRGITAFLTDLNSAGGMSGSPVFTPHDGKVVGLHFAGVPEMVGCAMPVDRHRVDGWVRCYERVFVHGEKPAFTMTVAGDVAHP